MSFEERNLCSLGLGGPQIARLSKFQYTDFKEVRLLRLYKDLPISQLGSFLLEMTVIL